MKRMGFDITSSGSCSSSVHVEFRVKHSHGEKYEYELIRELLCSERFERSSLALEQCKVETDNGNWRISKRLDLADGKFLDFQIVLFNFHSQDADGNGSLNEEKLRALFKFSPLGIALYRVDGRFLEANEAFQSICGYTLEELASKDYWELTPEEYASQELLQLHSLSQSGRYGPYEKEYIRKDGR